MDSLLAAADAKTQEAQHQQDEQRASKMPDKPRDESETSTRSRRPRRSKEAFSSTVEAVRPRRKHIKSGLFKRNKDGKFVFPARVRAAAMNARAMVLDDPQLTDEQASQVVATSGAAAALLPSRRAGNGPSGLDVASLVHSASTSGNDHRAHLEAARMAQSGQIPHNFINSPLAASILEQQARQQAEKTHQNRQFTFHNVNQEQASAADLAHLQASLFGNAAARSGQPAQLSAPPTAVPSFANAQQQQSSNLSNGQQQQQWQHFQQQHQQWQHFQQHQQQLQQQQQFAQQQPTFAQQQQQQQQPAHGLAKQQPSLAPPQQQYQQQQYHQQQFQQFQQFQRMLDQQKRQEMGQGQQDPNQDLARIAMSETLTAPSGYMVSAVEDSTEGGPRHCTDCKTTSSGVWTPGPPVEGNTPAWRCLVCTMLPGRTLVTGQDRAQADGEEEGRLPPPSQILLALNSLPAPPSAWRGFSPHMPFHDPQRLPRP